LISIPDLTLLPLRGLASSLVSVLIKFPSSEEIMIALSRVAALSTLACINSSATALFAIFRFADIVIILGGYHCFSLCLFILREPSLPA
jgi:hypothetical protein